MKSLYLLFLPLAVIATHEDQTCNIPPLDITYLMDSSGSIGPSDFELERQFVQDNIDSTTEQNSTVNVVRFASGASEVLSWNPVSVYQNDPSLVSNIAYTAGATHTSTGLRLALDRISYADPTTNRNVIFLITDGNPYPSSYGVCGTSAQTYNASMTFKEKIDSLNIIMLVITVGGSVDTTKVSCLVNDANHIININSFSDLESLNLISEICSCQPGQDISPPTFECPSETISLNLGPKCASNYLFPFHHLHDNCVNNTNITLSSSSFTFNTSGSKVRTVSATDLQGNTRTCTLQFSVQDITPPTVTCLAKTVDLNENCTATVPGMVVGSADNCGVRSVTQVPVPGTVVTAGQTVNGVVVDTSGNSYSCNATLRTRDNLSPKITCLFDSLFLEAEEDCCVHVGNLTAKVVDNCGGSWTVRPNTEQICRVGNTTIWFTARDPSGNIARCSTTVTVGKGSCRPSTCEQAGSFYRLNCGCYENCRSHGCNAGQGLGLGGGRYCGKGVCCCSDPESLCSATSCNDSNRC